MRTPIPPEERFFRHVNITEGCWLWTGMAAGTNSTYGYFRVTTSRHDPKVLAHRWSYEHHVGPIPEGYHIDHVKARGCTSTLCVNPAHLEAVPPAVNSERARLLVCRSGRHDLTQPENIRWDNQGRRRGCLACWMERQALRERT